MLNPDSQSKFQAARNKYRYSLSAAKCLFFSEAIIEAEGDQKKTLLNYKIPNCC